MANARRIEERIETILNAWRTLRPDKTFAGMTVAESQARIQASLDTRARIAALDAQREAAIADRDRADAETDRLLKLVINAVKGDVDEGPDSALYGAMGYVRDSERESGLKRGTRTKENTTPS